MQCDWERPSGVKRCENEAQKACDGIWTANSSPSQGHGEVSPLPAGWTPPRDYMPGSRGVAVHWSDRISKDFEIGLEDWICRLWEWISRTSGQDFADFAVIFVTKSAFKMIPTSKLKQSIDFCLIFIQFCLFSIARNLKNRAPVQAAAQFLQNHFLAFDAKRYRK